MKKHSEFEKLKQQVSELTHTWQKKLKFLSESVSRSGMEGVSHWLKSHHQIDELAEAIKELKAASDKDDFQLLQVETTLSSFLLPAEDLGQAEWYKFAHQYLIAFESELNQNAIFDLNKLQSAQKELRFISQADEFHQRYDIQSIQQKAAAVYQSIEQAISDYKSNEKEKQQQIKSENELKIAKIEAVKAQAEAKKAMLESVKMKEKRIAIMEEKKKKIAEREFLEAEEKKNFEEAELQAKQAEIERQYKLQDSYVELQLEERIAGWDINDLILKFTQKLQQTTLESEQQKSIESFISFLNSKLDN